MNSLLPVRTGNDGSSECCAASDSPCCISGSPAVPHPGVSRLFRQDCGIGLLGWPQRRHPAPLQDHPFICHAGDDPDIQDDVGPAKKKKKKEPM